MMLVAALIGAFSSVAGLYVSFYVHIASGAAVVLDSNGRFCGRLLLCPREGLVRTLLARRPTQHAGGSK